MTSWHSLPIEVKSLILKHYINEWMAIHRLEYKLERSSSLNRHDAGHIRQMATEQTQTMLQVATELRGEAYRMVNTAHEETKKMFMKSLFAWASVEGDDDLETRRWEVKSQLGCDLDLLDDLLTVLKLSAQ